MISKYPVLEVDLFYI